MHGETHVPLPYDNHCPVGTGACLSLLSTACAALPVADDAAVSSE